MGLTPSPRNSRNPSPRARRRARRAVVLPMLVLAALAAVGAEAQGGLTLGGTRGESLAEADLLRGSSCIVVWASWSPRGRDIAERVARLQGRWGSRCRVATVNYQETRQEVDAFLAGKNLPVPVFLDPDGAFSKKYAVTTLPGLLVFKDGQVAYRGRFPDDPDRVLGEIFGG